MIRYFKEGQFYLFLFPILFVGNHLFTITSLPPPRSTIVDYFLWLANLSCAGILCWLPIMGLFWLLRLKLDKIKSGLLAMIIFLPILFYQESFTIVNFLLNGHVRFRWLLSGIIVVTTVSSFLVASSKKPLILLNESFNMISLCLVGYVYISLIASFKELQPKRTDFDPPTLALECNNCPDIYFFLLDGYTSNKSLEDFFNFHNTDFSNKLRKSGFVVYDQASSHYSKTVYSLGATLNLDTLRDLDSFYEKDILKLIQKNTVAKSLQTVGYEIINFSWFDILDKPSFYSLERKFKFEFINGVFLNSIFRFLDGSENNPGNFSKFYKINTSILNEIRNASRFKRAHPAFFYAHVLSPHPPFVMDAEGQEIGILEQKPTQAEAYVDQVIGLNKLVYLAIDDILKNSENPIIIVQGDHGSRLLAGINKKEESYSVFFAHYGLRANELDGRSNRIFKTLLKNLERK